MKKDHLHHIVNLCLQMDEMAIGIYRNLSNISEHIELKEFWGHMSGEESQHVICWKDLLKLVEDDIIPQIFHDPEKTLKNLQQNHTKVVALSEQSKRKESITENFVLAFRLEFCLLHPALERLWHFYGIIKNDQYNPEQEYENHIHEFIEAMRKFGANTIELEALGETIEQMWSDSKSMAQEANFDSLTNVLNRRGLFNTMTSLAYLAKRNKFASAVIMIDIDHFKRINDTFGHQAGDDVLSEVAGIIKFNLRKSDILGRFGGEEFIVFLPQVEQGSVFSIAEKIRQGVEDGTKHKIPVTVSLGGAISSITDDIEGGIHQLIKKADQYLYEAKRKGRNQTIC